MTVSEDDARRIVEIYEQACDRAILQKARDTYDPTMKTSFELNVTEQPILIVCKTTIGD